MIAFTNVIVRPYEERDLQQLIEVYKSAFAEAPWDEFRKCIACGINYGKKEVVQSSFIPGGGDNTSRDFEYIVDSDNRRRLTECKNQDCKADMDSVVVAGCKPWYQTSRNLIEYWSSEAIMEDMDLARSQQKTIILVAANSDEIVGFTWGYALPIEKFPFLDGKVGDASYMDEIAVRGDKRLRGIGTLLGKAYLVLAAQKDQSEVVLRTDERNVASMALFQKLNFKDIPDARSEKGRVFDPKYPDRIYLQRNV